MLKNIFYKVTGDPNDKEIKRLEPIVEEINALEPEYEKLSDEELARKTQEFRADLNESLDAARREWDELNAQLDAETDEEYRRDLERQVKEREKELLKLEQQTLGDLLPDAFAAVREASKRGNGQ